MHETHMNVDEIHIAKTITLNGQTGKSGYVLL
jgi:hypothetical protein